MLSCSVFNIITRFLCVILLSLYLLTNNKVNIYKYIGINYQSKKFSYRNKVSTKFQKQENVDMQNTHHTNKYNEYYK
jgi:hypothetical protein